MYSLEINDRVLRNEDQHVLKILFDSIDACESFSDCFPRFNKSS